MRREQMEHILRAAAAITNEREFVVVGSQALLAVEPQLPPPLNKSMELDLYPLNDPAKADLIDGSIGEMSPFDETFGYYGHGIGKETAILPKHWRSRAIRVENENTGSAIGICISPVDVAASKIIAGRDKDVEFVKQMMKAEFVHRSDMINILDELDEPHRSRLAHWCKNN